MQQMFCQSIAVHTIWICGFLPILKTANERSRENIICGPYEKEYCRRFGVENVCITFSRLLEHLIFLQQPWVD